MLQKELTILVADAYPRSYRVCTREHEWWKVPSRLSLEISSYQGSIRTI